MYFVGLVFLVKGDRKGDATKARFSLQKILQNFSDSPSHRIFKNMHEALNIDKK
jgi:hypothetical protein